MIKWNFLYIPRTPFYYNLHSCPANPLLINHVFSWKSKLKRTSVDITCFFQDEKIFNNKT